jgi:hypothetical protein
MYSFVLILHSLVRWLVLLAGIAAAAWALIGWFSQREWTSLDNRLGLFFTVGVDVQLLLGLILYLFLSPITTTALSDLGTAMSDPEARFYVMEHVFYMIAALALAHVGRATAKRATESVSKHKRVALFFTLALALIVIGIPWSRPLLRLG